MATTLPPISGVEREASDFGDGPASPDAFITGVTTGDLDQLSPKRTSPVYRVEKADISDTTQLPASIPLDKEMTNIKNNLNFHFHFTSNATKALKRNRNAWFKDFQAEPSKRLICDAFWFCICKYFKKGQHEDVERELFDRISESYVELYNLVRGPATRKDFFFGRYADAIWQAVLYSMFLAYPKSRVHFTDTFRRELVRLFSYWTTGIHPEFVDTTHWILNLGGGDVLQSTAALQGKEETLSIVGRESVITHRAPRPVKSLRYSPLVEHFLATKRYSSANLISPLKVALTTAEERCRLMDVKHGLLVERAHESRQKADQLKQQYDAMNDALKLEERKAAIQVKNEKKKLEIRRKDVLRADTHEYANYLASIHLLQEMGSRP